MASLLQRTPSQAAYGNVIRTYGLIQRVMRPYFQQYGLSQAQWAILRALYRAQNEGRTSGLRMGELGQRLLVQPPSVTMLVRRLVKAKLVAQATTPTDRRSFELRLTKKGENVVRCVLEVHQAKISEVMGGLDDEDLNVLTTYLERINTHLTALAAKTPDTLD
jgi:DNA-binding MarR family transcriptional regulator